MLLLDSFHKDDPNSLSELRSECAHLSLNMWDRACRDKLAKEKGDQTPRSLQDLQATKGNTTEWTSQKTSSSNNSSSLKNNKNKNNSKKVSLGQTLAHSKSLSREAKQRGVKQKLALPGVQLTLLSLRGSLTSFSEQDGVEHAGRWVMIPKLAGTTTSSTSSTTNKKLGNKQATCSNRLQQLQNNSCKQQHATTA